MANFYRVVRIIECIDSCKSISNKSLPANIHIRVRRSVVQVPIRNTRINTVVPVTTEESKLALYNPIYILKYKPL